MSKLKLRVDVKAHHLPVKNQPHTPLERQVRLIQVLRSGGERKKKLKDAFREGCCVSTVSSFPRYDHWPPYYSNLGSMG